MEKLIIFLVVIIIIATLLLSVFIKNIIAEKNNLSEDVHSLATENFKLKYDKSLLQKENDISIEKIQVRDDMIKEMEDIINRSKEEAIASTHKVVALHEENKSYIRLLTCIDTINIIKSPIKSLIVSMALKYELSEQAENDVNSYLKKKKSNYRVEKGILTNKNIN